MRARRFKVKAMETEMGIAAHQAPSTYRSDEEEKAIRTLVAQQRLSREAAERLVEEVGTDPEKLKAAACLEKNLPRSR